MEAKKENTFFLFYNDYYNHITTFLSIIFLYIVDFFRIDFLAYIFIAYLLLRLFLDLSLLFIKDVESMIDYFSIENKKYTATELKSMKDFILQKLKINFINTTISLIFLTIFYFFTFTLIVKITIILLNVRMVIEFLLRKKILKNLIEVKSLW